MSTQRLWRSQRINIDLTRIAVVPTALVWNQTIFNDIWFSCFESDQEVQEHPLTMLTRFGSGSFFPPHSHPGGEEVLVLQGNFIDETGIHPPGTYILNPEGFIHSPYSNEGCLTFVKLRQYGGKNRQQIRTNIFELSWQPGIIPKIQVQLLYQQRGYSEKIWVERWLPGAQLSNVVETQVKEIFVLEGIWSDDLGNYPSGSWLRYPPTCLYHCSSETGCLIYVKTYPETARKSWVGE